MTEPPGRDQGGTGCVDTQMTGYCSGIPEESRQWDGIWLLRDGGVDVGLVTASEPRPLGLVALGMAGWMVRRRKRVVL